MGEKDAAEEVRFFSVSLINPTPMPVPKVPQRQSTMGELIHSIEAANPRFAWVRFSVLVQEDEPIAYHVP